MAPVIDHLRVISVGRKVLSLDYVSQCCCFCFSCLWCKKWREWKETARSMPLPSLHFYLYHYLFHMIVNWELQVRHEEILFTSSRLKFRWLPRNFFDFPYIPKLPQIPTPSLSVRLARSVCFGLCVVWRNLCLFVSPSLPSHRPSDPHTLIYMAGTGWNGGNFGVKSTVTVMWMISSNICMIVWV